MTSGTSLFTDPFIIKETNFLYANKISIENEMRNGVQIKKTITRDDELSANFVKLRDQLIIQNETTINELILTNIETLEYSFTAFPVGPYMTVRQSINTMGIDTKSIRTVKTYKLDGSVITYTDIFKPGVDYKTIIKNELKKFIEEHGFVEIYDLEVLFESLQISLNGGGSRCYVNLSNKDIRPPARNEGEFNFSFDLNSYEDVMILEKWNN